jgi:Co/Zn/Cd efflux system component
MMAMHHGPASHGGHMMPASSQANVRALTITGWLTGLYFAVELGVGLWTGSVAVISDAFHTFSARWRGVDRFGSRTSGNTAS